MKLLVDADFFVALAKEDDANHHAALERTNELQDIALFVTPFAIPKIWAFT